MATTGPDGRDRLDQLPRVAMFWPTPRTISGGPESAARKKELGRENSGGGDIQAAVMDWPTPNASRVTHRGDTTFSGDDRETPNKLGWATEVFPRDPTTTPAGRACSQFVQTLPQRRLNPAFVEWLMGFPPGWLDATGVPSSELSEMLSAPTSPR